MTMVRAVEAHRALRIGELAALAGTTADTLRFYERRGLLEPAARSAGRYRLYDRSSLERLAFIRKAQVLGLSLAEVREVLRASARGTRPCEHVRATLAARLRDVDSRIAELRSLRGALSAALARSRALPVARSCVCDIIESQELSPAAQRVLPDRARRRAHHRKEAV